MLEDKPVACLSEGSRLAFRERYISRLLPLLMSINEQGSRLTMHERLRAIRYATDMSLALAARGVSWSRALSRELSPQSESCNTLDDDSFTWRKPMLSRNFYSCKNAGLYLRNRQRAVTTATKRATASRLHYSGICRNHLFIQRLKKRFLVRHYRSRQAAYLKALRSSIPHACRQQKRTCPPGTYGLVTESQITSLRDIIPGGGDMDTPVLLKEAADYIVSLQIQVEALESLAEAASC